MEKRLWFTAALVMLNLCAAAGSFASGDWKRGIYWLASAICLVMVSL